MQAGPYIKFLNDSGAGKFSGWLWPLPKGTSQGEWTPVIPSEKLMLCVEGYHFCAPEDLLGWNDSRMFIFEPHPDAGVVYRESKGACTQARLVKEIPFSWAVLAATVNDLLTLFCAEQYHYGTPAVDMSMQFNECLAGIQSIVTDWVECEKGCPSDSERLAMVNLYSERLSRQIRTLCAGIDNKSVYRNIVIFDRNALLTGLHDFCTAVRAFFWGMSDTTNAKVNPDWKMLSPIRHIANTLNRLALYEYPAPCRQSTNHRVCIEQCGRLLVKHLLNN